MAVYAVIASGNASEVKRLVVAQYGASHYEFSQNVWFVTDSATSKEVADKLGITKGDGGILGAVLRFDAYSGRHASTAWTWLQAIPGTIPNG
jgi:hypothetical protein